MRRGYSSTRDAKDLAPPPRGPAPGADWQPLRFRKGDRVTIEGETYVVTAINPSGDYGLSLDLDAEDPA